MGHRVLPVPFLRCRDAPAPTAQHPDATPPLQPNHPALAGGRLPHSHDRLPGPRHRAE